MTLYWLKVNLFRANLHWLLDLNRLQVKDLLHLKTTSIKVIQILSVTFNRIQLSREENLQMKKNNLYICLVRMLLSLNWLFNKDIKCFRKKRKKRWKNSWYRSQLIGCFWVHMIYTQMKFLKLPIFSRTNKLWKLL